VALALDGTFCQSELKINLKRQCELEALDWPQSGFQRLGVALSSPKVLSGVSLPLIDSTASKLLRVNLKRWSDPACL
jgi:hypothetical protein